MRGLASRFDQLALLGKPLDYEDKIEYIIDGLPEDYKSVVEQVEGRDTTPSIVEIHEKLVNKMWRSRASGQNAAVCQRPGYTTGLCARRIASSLAGERDFTACTWLDRTSSPLVVADSVDRPKWIERPPRLRSRLRYGRGSHT